MQILDSHSVRECGVAESNDVRFQLFEEIVPRLASTGQTAKALELVNAYGQRFTEPAQQTVVNRLRTEVTSMADFIRDEEANGEARQAAISRTTQVNELRRRLEVASASGDADLVAHYQQALLEPFPIPIQEV